MKNIFLLCFLFLGITLSAQVPGEKLVPKPVLTKFAAEYPGIKATRWEVKWGKQYEAVLIHDGKPARARYAADGTPLFIAHHWKGADVPAIVVASLMVKYPGFKVDWATQTKNFKTGTDRFWVHLSQPGLVLKAFLNADGTIVTNASEEELKDAQTEN